MPSRSGCYPADGVDGLQDQRNTDAAPTAANETTSLVGPPDSGGKFVRCYQDHGSGQKLVTSSSPVTCEVIADDMIFSRKFLRDPRSRQFQAQQVVGTGGPQRRTCSVVEARPYVIHTMSDICSTAGRIQSTPTLIPGKTVSLK